MSDDLELALSGDHRALGRYLSEQSHKEGFLGAVGTFYRHHILASKIMTEEQIDSFRQAHLELHSPAITSIEGALDDLRLKGLPSPVIAIELVRMAQAVLDEDADQELRHSVF